jgi:Tfp pilus assembly protein PilW
MPLKKETDLSFPVLSRKCLPEKQEGKLLVWLLVTANIGMVLVVVLLSLVLVTLSNIPPWLS